MKIEIKEFSYTYPGRNERTLDNISIDIAEGECCGVIGLNGSGKTTLALSIMGIIPNYNTDNFSGEVLVNDYNPAISEVFSPENPVGLVSANPRALFVGRPTIKEEIAVGPENQGMRPDKILQVVSESAKKFEISHILNSNWRNISGGEEQRLAIACNMVINPHLIIFDEPTTSLDPKGITKLFELINDLKTTGVTILFFDNRNLELIAKVVDKVVILHEGKIVTTGLPKPILSSSILDKLSIGSSIYTHLAKNFTQGSPSQVKNILPITLEEVIIYIDENINKSK